MGLRSPRQNRRDTPKNKKSKKLAKKAKKCKNLDKAKTRPWKKGIMALQLTIYRDTWNDSANIFYGRDRITVVNIPGPFEPLPGEALALLEQHVPGACRLVPAQLIGSEWKPLEGMTNGGTYAATSDSRFDETMRELLGGNFYGAVAVHDRLHWNFEAAN